MKLNLLFGLLFISATTISGQETKRHQLGGHVGVTISTIKGPSTIMLFDNANMSNIYFGLDYHYNFTKVLGFETQLNFLNIGCGQKDAAWDGINDNITGKVDLNTDLKYIHLPVSFTISPLKRDIVVFNLGFYGSRLLSAKIIGNPVDYNRYLRLPINEDIKDIIKKWDLGFTFGIRSEMPISKFLSICLNGGYNLGLIKLQKDTDEKYYNSFFTIALGVKVQMGK